MDLILNFQSLAEVSFYRLFKESFHRLSKGSLNRRAELKALFEETLYRQAKDLGRLGEKEYLHALRNLG